VTDGTEVCPDVRLYPFSAEVPVSRIFLVGFDSEAGARIAAALPARHDVVELGTAEAALARLDVGLPDAVVVNFPVPCRDGRALTAVLRQDPRTRALPILAVSRWSWHRTRETATRLGCTAFVAMDAPDAELRQALRRVLREPALRPRPLAPAGSDCAGSDVA
jgi:two-component system, cell cycle response regulator DivK